ncbi:peroxiredoxin type-2 [Amphichorda felina]
MTELKVGDSFPEGVAFSYAPITPENSEITSCGIPQKFDASEGKPPNSPISFPNLHLVIGRTRDSHPAEFKKKKVVLVSVPGAFTPTCSVSHIPSYIQNADKLKAQGVDQIVVIAFNDAWVMSAWGKANGIKDDFIIFACDTDAKFSKSIGWTAGERTARYAIVIDHGKVTYAAKEEGRGIEKSGAEAVLAKL